MENLDQRPFIKLFRTHGACYFFDVNVNKIINVDEDTFGELVSMMKDDKYNSKRISKLKRQGYLSNVRSSRIEHPSEQYLPNLLKRSLNTLTLQVTQRCNLRCHYCAYGGQYLNRSHDERDMTFEIAKKSMDMVVSRSQNSHHLHIGFYGGEPMLRFDFIKKCVEYIKEVGEGKDISFNMTTNGTLFNAENMEFLKDNDFSILISLDGPKENHDKNRVFSSNNKGSYDAIMRNVESFRQKYPEYSEKNIGFNAVLDKEVSFKCASEYFSSYELIKDLQLSMSLIDQEYLKDGSKETYDDTFIEQYSYERFKVILGELGYLSRDKVSRFFRREFSNIKTKYSSRMRSELLTDVVHPGGPCIPCIRKLFVSVDGTIYPCERVSEISEPMKLGNVKNCEIDIEKAKAMLSIGKITEDECLKCWAIRDCSQCVKGADGIDHLSSEERLRHCDSIRNSVLRGMIDYSIMTEMGYSFTNYGLENYFKCDR